MTRRKRIPPKTKEIVYKKFEGHCAYCGVKISLREMQVDHVMPLYRGGTDDLSNFLPSCRPCNYYKGTKTIEEFRQEIGKLKERLERSSFIYRLAKRYYQITENVAPVKFYFESVEQGVENEVNQQRYE